LRHALSETHPVSIALRDINTRLSTPMSIAMSLELVAGKPIEMANR
jgi:hypothetical protein